MAAPDPALQTAAHSPKEAISFIATCLECPGVSPSTTSTPSPDATRSNDPFDSVAAIAASMGLTARLCEEPLPHAIRHARENTPLLFLAPKTGNWIVATASSALRTRIVEHFHEPEPRSVTRAHLALTLGLQSPNDSIRFVLFEPILPAANLAPHPDDHHHPSPQRRFLSLLALEKDSVGMLLVFSLFSGLLYLAAPLAIDAVVSNLAFGTEQKPYLQALVALSLALFAFLLVQAVVRGFQHYVAEIIQRRIFVRTATDLAHRLPRLNSAALDEIHAPEMVNRFMEVVTAQKTTALLLLDGINLVFSCATGLVLLALYHPVLLAFAAILFTLLTIVLLALGRGAIPTSIRESLFKYQLVHWFEQIAANPVLFKSRGGLALASSKASTLIHSYLESRSSHFRILMRQIAGLLSLQVISSAALLGVGGWLVISQQLTLGQLVASEIIMTSIVTSLGKLGKKLEAWYDVMAAMDKLGHMFDLPVESTSGETPTFHTPPSIETHGLVVTSPAGKPVTMPDIVLQPGQKASLTANEGEPASLLADVLFGLRPQSSGSARINGLDIRDWNLANLRAHTLLLRPLEIVEGSIADNLRLGNEEIGPDEMLRALLLSGLTADGSLRLSSPLKLGGYPLTPLQRARLLTARALVQKPHLLLLDRVFDGLHQNDARFLLSLLLEAEHPWTIISSAQSDLPHPGWTLHLNINA